MVEEAPGWEVTSRSRLWSTICSFVPDPDQVETIEPFGDGNINATYLVLFRQRPSLVVQRLNGDVFPDPLRVAGNVARVTAFLSARLATDSGSCRSCRFPTVVQTGAGGNWFEDQSGGVWRCLSYIDNAVSYPRVMSPEQPSEAGKMLGCFHSLLESFDGSVLSDPLPGFHHLQHYKSAYLDSIASHRRALTSELRYCRKMIEERLENWSLDKRAQDNQVPRRVIHGDPKCDNFLFDIDSGQAISIIDLDTVSHGLVAVDLGDCLRSFCNPAGERGRSGITFDIGICQRLLRSYFEVVNLGQAERTLLYHGVRLLTYELGLRFFTDHLNGDRYFRIAREGENLHRAWVQLKLMESIEGQRLAIEQAAGVD
ncbi:MAG: aminoglycoside phosphotransferase family protein [Desulfofustis sp.]